MPLLPILPVDSPYPKTKGTGKAIIPATLMRASAATARRNSPPGGQLPIQTR